MISSVVQKIYINLDFLFEWPVLYAVFYDSIAKSYILGGGGSLVLEPTLRYPGVEGRG